MKGRVWLRYGALLILILAVMGTLIPACAAKTAFPEKDVNWIVFHGPGGGFDAYARAIAPYMKKYLPNKVNVIVQNMEGAGTRRGTTYVYKSQPDGYNIGMPVIPGMLVTQKVETVEFDLTKVAYIGNITSSFQCVIVSGKAGINSLADLKAKRDLAFGLQTGTSSDIEGTVLIDQMGLTGKVRYIAGYKGMEDVVTGVMRGDSDFAVTDPTAYTDFIRKGDLKVVAIFDKERSQYYPNVPTAVEQGYPDVVFRIERPLFVAPGTPEPIVKVLEKALMDALADQDLLAWAKKTNSPIDPLGAAGTQKLVRDLSDRFSKYVPLFKARLAAAK